MAWPAWLSSLLLSVLQVLFSSFSGTIKSLLTEFIRDLYAKALSSESPFDDFGVTVLAFILGISLEGVTPAPPVPGVNPQTMTPKMAGMLLKGMERTVYEKVYTWKPDDATSDEGHPIYDAP